MITNPTVFILGAGASKPYGFPIGQELFNIIVQKLGKRNWVDILNKIDVGDEDIKEFKNALIFSGKSSIDSFLETRTEFIKLGKLCIALALIPYENEGALFSLNTGESNWYRFLFSKLSLRREDFEDSKVSFLTFNYDRSLEHYLFNSIKNGFGISDDKSKEILNKLNIIHLHGQLGYLLWQDTTGFKRNYGPSVTNLIELEKASESIKIIYESIDNDPEFQKAKKLLSNAKNIHFLGFGYNDINLSRLGIDKLIDLIPHSKREVRGTSYKLGLAEQKDIMSRWNKIELCDSSYDVTAYLKNIVSFR